MKHIACFSLLVFPLAAMVACSSSSSGNGAPNSFDGGATDSGSASDSGNVNASDGGDGGLSVVACTTAPSFNWARTAGGAGSSDVANGIAVDASGNVYITGSFIGDATFGSFALTNADKSKRSIFVAKLDQNGVFQWAKAFGAEGDDYGVGVGVDTAGDVFVTGLYQSTVMFDTKSVTASNPGPSAFEIRLTPENGDIVWAFTTGAPGSVKVNALTVDGAGNSYLAGGFIGNVTISGTIMLSGDGTTVPDAFIAEIDANGNPVTALTANGPGDEGGEFVGVGFDSGGYMYGAGNVVGSLTFPGPTTLDGDGTFFVKYDLTHTMVLFAKQGTTTGSVSYASMALGADGTGYMTGQLTGTASFNGTTVASTGAEKDALVMAYDPTGNPMWAKHGGATGFDSAGTAISFDGANALYVTGSAPGAATFDNQDLPATAGGFFVLKYDLTGAPQYFATNTGGTGAGAAIVARPSSGGTYVAGSYGASSSFGSFALTSAGGNDSLVARICN